MISNTKIEPLNSYFDELSKHLEAHGFVLVVADEDEIQTPNPELTLTVMPIDSETLNNKPYPPESSLARLCRRMISDSPLTAIPKQVILTESIIGHTLNISVSKTNTLHLTFRLFKRTPNQLQRNPIWT